MINWRHFRDLSTFMLDSRLVFREATSLLWWSRKQLKAILVFGIVIEAIVPVSLHAQFRMKDWGNRYEGVETLKEGTPNYEVIGFYGYRTGTPLSRATSLHIRFYSPEPGPIFIQSQEINDMRHYRMQPKSENAEMGKWNEFSGWPARDVLIPLGVVTNELAVTIRRGTPDENTRQLTPALLHDGTFPQVVEDYVMYWRSSMTLETLSYQLICQDNTEKLQKYPPAPGSDTIDTFQTLELRFNAKGIDDGWCLIELKGTYPHLRTGFTEDYRFFHKRDTH
jgi:hypothetical protein